MFRQYNAGASRPADIRLGLFVLDGLSPSKPIERNPLSPDPPFLMFVYYPYLLFFFELPLFFSFFLSFVRHVYCVQRPFPIRFRANGVSIIFFYWASSYRGTVGGCYVVRDYEMNLVTFENIERSNDAFSSMLLLVGSESSLLHQET